MCFRHIKRRRQIIDDGVEQRLYALVFERGSDYHRKYFQRNGRFAQRGAQRVRADLFAFEKFVQDFVVVFRDALNQLGVEGFRFLLQVGGNFFGDVLRAHGVVDPDDRLHFQQIDDATEFIFLADGNLDGNGLGAEALTDGIDGVLEIRTHLVNLVDETNSRDTVFIGLPPDFFRLRLHAMHSVKHGDGAIEHAQRTLDLGCEIDVAGRIDNFNADIAPGAGRRSGRDRDAALLLLLHPVHGGSAFVHLSDAVRLSRIKQDALRRSGLTGIDVGHDADVPAAI